MEGLRFLPWLWEAERRNPSGSILKCDNCMNAYTQETRQQMGCGFEPPPVESKRAYVQMWNGGSLPNYKGPKATVCPGYTSSLPEVIEVARARMHWEKGELAAFTRGELSEGLTTGIEILEGAINAQQLWSHTDIAKGGGRE